MSEYLYRNLKKSQNWYFRRRVPADLQGTLEKRLIETPLRTSDKREAKRRAAVINGKLEEQWESVRATISPTHQLRFGADWIASSLASDQSSVDGRAKYPVGTSESQVGPMPGVPSQPVRVDPRCNRAREAKISFQEAYTLWVRERRPSYHAARGADRVVEKFTALFDDVSLDTITRLQARKYRDHLHSTGISPSTISTYISYLRAIYETALKEELVRDRSNPFSALNIERDKHPEEEREPIPRESCLEILKQTLADGYDEADWFAAIMLTTGTRPGEAYRAKLNADAEIPHWSIPRFKTSPPRVIPVHPLLLSKEPPKFTVRAEQLRRAFIARHKPYTAYQSRHAWKQEALRVGIPLELRMKLMGHSLRKVIGEHGRYGASGVELEMALPWIEKMWG